VDTDPEETREWLESLDAVHERAGGPRARSVLHSLLSHARATNIGIGELRSTDYINTIPPESEPDFPGDEDLERRIRSYIRWNAAIMVHRAQRPGVEVGGHISTYASSAAMYEVGFNHFFRGKQHPGGGDQIFFQGHASPGMYARAFLEGRLSQLQLDGFRQELSHPGGGLSSYPHPRLMPEFWEFPTVSMGLGPIGAIYQARFNRYLTARGICDTKDQHVWAFLGDGEMDEPESLGAIGVAAREQLGNLTFVVNCNLQRLDGPVRGNGKIIQELEGTFRGAGWNVIKVVWGREWDSLLAADTDGSLLKIMNETPDGDYQTYKAESGAYVREHFFGRDPRARALVEQLSDDEVWKLRRGGHDYRKLYAAYSAAMNSSGRPTVILAKTVKGWTLGSHFESRNATHQMKKLTAEDLAGFRDRLEIPIPDEKLDKTLPPYYHPGKDSPEFEYLMQRRRELGGPLPQRIVRAKPLTLPGSAAYEPFTKGSGKQPVATTMAFVRILKELMKDPEIGRRFVPIIPDEARTFGMDSLFPTAKIYSHLGQRYTSVDRELMLAYKETEDGQILHEGINEAGSAASFTAAGSAYATHGEHMIPVYVFYSMFGFQRTGDSFWQAADQMTRGFAIGATAGRTTLNGEGLQHEDGHSQLLAATNPAVISYDPAWAYEVAIIVEDGLRRMYGEPAPDVDPNVFYYLTVYNEPVQQPAAPEGLDVEGVRRGIYHYSAAPKKLQSSAAPKELLSAVAPKDVLSSVTAETATDGPAAQLPVAQILASGIALPWAMRAQQMLAAQWGVAADVWSVTSWNELRRDAVAAEEAALLRPDQPGRTPYVTQQLSGAGGPFIAVSDWMRLVPDQISRWVPGDYTSLGTDGFGRSDTRAALRRFFHTDAESITVTVLRELVRRGEYPAARLRDAVNTYAN